MNYLAHVLLSECNDESRIGSLLADFTNISNSSLAYHFSKDICSAIIVHRQIDQYTDSHSDTLSSIRFFFPKYRHFSRILIDILYDHFLSVHWNLFCDQTLDAFVEDIYRTFRNLPSGLPPKFTYFSSNMIRYDILRAYLTFDDLHEVLSRVDKRFKEPVGLQNAIHECVKHYEDLNRLFLHFFPEILRFTKSYSESRQ